MTHEEASRILKEFGIVYNQKDNMSQLGGMKILLELLKKGQYRDRLSEILDGYKSRSILQLMIGLWAGARTMVEVGNTGKDPLVKRFLENPVEEAQLGRDFKSFDRSQVESLHDFNVSQTIFDLAQKIPHSETLYFDIDATSVEKYGSQEGVEKGYVGKDLPESCYQYLLIYFNNRKTFLNGTIRGGSAHSQNDFCGYLQRFLPLFEKRWKTVFRADSGYYNESAFDIFSENDCTFFIKAPMSESRQNFVQLSNSLVWVTEVNGVAYASYTTNTAKGTKFREIYKRTPIDSGKQLLLGEIASYRYDCLATNDLSAEENTAFEIYNKRANIENAIKELKEDYQLGRIVTDDFNANDAITQVTFMSYMLVQLLKNDLLPPKLERARLSTLRTQVFNIPGCLVHWARRQIMRVQNIFTDELSMAFIVKNLKGYRSWVLYPPLIFEAEAA